MGHSPLTNSIDKLRITTPHAAEVEHAKRILTALEEAAAAEKREAH